MEASRPQKIILFGSRARGEARPDSDIDLLVIAKSRQQRAAPLYGAVSDILVAMDILVYTPEEVRVERGAPGIRDYCGTGGPGPL